MRKLFFLWSLKVSLLVDENSEFQLHFQFLESNLVELECQSQVVKNHDTTVCPVFSKRNSGQQEYQNVGCI